MSFKLNKQVSEITSLKSPSETLELRLVTEEYVKQVISVFEETYCMDPDYPKTLYGEHPKSINFAVSRFCVRSKCMTNEYLSLGACEFDSLYYSIVKRDDNSIVGTLEVHGSPFTGAKLGLFIGKPYASLGYGSEAVKTAMAMLTECTKVEKVIWECYADNIGSIKVAQKCGFHDTESDWIVYADRKAKRFEIQIQRKTENTAGD